MLNRFFWGGLLTAIAIGRMHGQEVIVAREKKPELSTEAPTPPEQPALESPTPTPRPSKPRTRKSPPARLTLEEMRSAGARAAGGMNEASVSQSSRTGETDVPGAQMPTPTVAARSKSAKSEPLIEERTPSHSSRSRGTTLEGMGPIRPTLMESGRESASPSPGGR